MRLRTVALVSLALLLSVLLGVSSVGGTPRALAQGGPCLSGDVLCGLAPPPPPGPNIPIGPCIQIYPPPPGCGGAGSISTDQSQYYVGSPIRICYTVPGPGPVTIIDQQPGGLTHTLLSVYDDGTGWCFPGTVTPPPGTECLFMYFGGYYGGPYYPGGPYASGGQSPLVTYGGNVPQTCFQVIGYGGGGGCNGPIQTINATGGSSSVSLRTGQCFLLVLDSNLNWTFSVDDPSILSCGNGYPAPGQSVTCTALSPGSTTLRATGNPTCYPQCLLPSQLFTLSVYVYP
jgi:hypothetical protein